ncbi:MAG: hypothetical protein E6600_04435 [Anaerocolumna aminovalerica]|uniref:hypothetical protein n=1 Tax=Anaerocolumna aminovalerica TaxID=1527 RepID=UPI0029089515|nr:hypothetical protein [Anaerocolumna aminovalerica]MDU6263729.1 hypothetical protein [Anaerocolumna aminovalerica]
MNNTSSHFECEIDNLGYSTIEWEIANYFDMGMPDNSSIPPQMREDSCEDCTLICTKKSGDFSIRNYKLKDRKYLLSVSLKGKLHNS